MSERFHTLDAGVLVAPSILGCDLARLGDEVATVIPPPGAGDVRSPRGVADLIHIDVMDGHFVPNLTMGPAICASLRRARADVCLDVHLMVTDPGMFVEPFVGAGADHISFHLEAAGSVERAAGLAEQIRAAGAAAGVAISPDTPLSAWLDDPWSERLLAAVDLVLIMTVRPGFAGQRLISSSFEKVAALRTVFGSRKGRAPRLQVDGGIDLSSATVARANGADVLVAASSVFGVESGARASVIAGLRGGDAVRE